MITRLSFFCQVGEPKELILTKLVTYTKSRPYQHKFIVAAFVEQICILLVQHAIGLITYLVAFAYTRLIISSIPTTNIRLLNTFFFNFSIMPKRKLQTTYTNSSASLIGSVVQLNGALSPQCPS